MVPVNGSGKPSIPPASPSQRHKGQCTRSEEVQCLRIGCTAPINKNKRGIDRSIDATTTSKLHEGRRWVELNRDISRRANPLPFWRAPSDFLSRLRRPWAAARAGRASRSITPSRRLACGALAGGPPPTGAPSSHPARLASPAPGKQPGTQQQAQQQAQQQSQQQAQQRGRSHRPAPPLMPLHEEPRHTLTAWRPRS